MSEAEGGRPSRLAGADVVRAGATLGVILIHASHWPLQDSGVEGGFYPRLDLIARFSVPAFVILAGVLLGYREGSARPGLRWLGRRLRRATLPWFVWAPVYLVLGWTYTNEVARTAGGSWSWLALGAGHLWFLLVIPQLYLLFMLWPSSSRGATWLAVGLMGFQLVLDWFRLYGSYNADNPLLGFLLLAHDFQFAWFWIGYFATGIALGHRLRRGWSPRPWFTAALAGLAVATSVLLITLSTAGSPRATFGEGTGGFLVPLMVPFAVSITLLGLLQGGALLHSPRVARVVGSLSRHSLGVYIVHEALVYIPGRALHDVLQQPLPVSLAAMAVQFVIATALALGVTRLLVATPLAITLGEQRQPLHRARVLGDGAAHRGG